jgi:hypothetical protein
MTLFISLTGYASSACDLCKAKQPKGFENITHGEGPEGNIDYIIMYGAILIVGYTLFMSIKYLVHPKEKMDSHIKNIVTKNT